jgi:[ribosomal protein S18]-alanine N-acetyltransferase
MESSNAVVRRMTLKDVDDVHRIEADSFTTPWSRGAFEDELTENQCARYLVAESCGEIVAYAGAWMVLDECHITNIAVRRDKRGKGYGRLITQSLIQYATNLGASFVTLEVRRSNLTAQSLYRSLGFLQVGCRRRYYEDNGEDAILMACQALPPVEPNFREEETVEM